MVRKYLLFLLFIFAVTTYCSAAVDNGGEEGGSNVRRYTQDHKLEILTEYIKLLSVPNVSSDRPNIRKNAQLIRDMMSARSIETTIMETSGNPVLYGEILVPGAEKTLMFYVHYDGQPVNEAQWVDSMPFQPVLRPGKLETSTNRPEPVPFPATGSELGDDWRLYGRSTSDDKAPIIAILSALDAMKAEGIPVRNNLKFILDGEEEAGSPSLLPFIRENKHLLSSDILFMCDGPTYYTGDPTLFFGVRGIVGIEITVYGPNVNLHSGHFGNWAPNPAMMLSRLLASMKDDSGRVLIDGFYDGVISLTASEREALAKIPPYEDNLKELYEFSAVEGGGMSLMESIQLPSLNINGLVSGWVGEQSRTIIPAEASVSLDIRLVKGNQPEDMVKKVISHIRKQGYFVVTDVPGRETRMKYGKIARVSMESGGYPASRLELDHPLAGMVVEALEVLYEGRLVILPTLGGSLPIHHFAEILDVPVIGLPVVNHDNNQHQANENIRLGHLWSAIETFAAIFKMSGPQK